VTGATSGIGRALAEALAAAGVTVGVVARDRARGEAVREAIVSRTGNERIELYHGDLASLASVRGLAGSLTAAHPTLDALVHCAAAYVPRRMMTVDGFETMFATNHLAPFLLTSLLWPSLASSDAARVLVLTAPSTVQPDFDDLQGERRFRSLAAFGSTKAAELLFTFGLARRIAGGRITANAVHPGLARTNLMRGSLADPLVAAALLTQPRTRRGGRRATGTVARLRGPVGPLLPSGPGDRPAVVRQRCRAPGSALGRQ
jgi:NAD(P)-dependent dehydrogenase (short-subunit alcohol dehydrogenase family)